MNVIRLAGLATERGATLGSLESAVLKEVLAHRRDFPEPARLRAVVTPYAECTQRHLPELAAEVRGLADGAGITLEEAWWLQLRRELWAGSTNDCSTVAVTGVVGQTVDLPARWGIGLRVLELDGDEGEPAALALTVAGLTGYLGLNAAGLAVGINMVHSGDWRVGVPPYLLIRAVLQCRSIDQALALLDRVPRASSRCFTIVDALGAARVEMTATKLRTTRADLLTATNHFQHPALVPEDATEGRARMESRLRLARLRRLLPDDLGAAEAGVRARMLRQVLLHPVLQLAPTAPDAVTTVATVVLQAPEGVVHVRPQGGPWHAISGSWVARGT